MKKITLLILCFASSFLLQSQSTEIWGAFEKSNQDDLGSIFKIDSSSHTATIEKTFERNGYDGFELTKASDGNYYGLRSEWFANSGRTNIIYKVDPITNTSEEILRFPLAGMYSEQSSGLIEARPGELWGVASSTGINDKGIVYSYSIATNTITIEHNLSTVGLDYPNGSLVKAPNGKLYGAARGIQMPFPYQGAIYEIDLVTNTITSRYRFSRNLLLGTMPNGQMVVAPNGKLYGICMLDGSFTGDGTLFEYNTQTHQIIKRVTFTQTGPTGDLPLTNLFLANNGKIYGSTENGGANGEGTLYEYTPGTYNATKKIDLDTNSNRLSLSYDDGNGRLLGFHSNQSPDLSGVMSYNTITNSIAPLYTFNELSWGKIYKESPNRYFLGGEYVMEFDSLFVNNNLITKSGSTVNGGNISSSFTKGNDGKLYSYSAKYIEGVEFVRIDPLTKELEVIKRTAKRDSIWNVKGKMLLHPNGNFYVAFSFNANTYNPKPNDITRSGILELNPITDSLRIAYLFPNNMSEISSLVLDTANNFYGLSRKGDARFSRYSYLFKVRSALDSVEILRTWYSSSRSIFGFTDILIDTNVIFAPYNDPYAGYFRYFIKEDSLRSGSFSGSTPFANGGFVLGEDDLCYGIIDDRVVQYNLVTNQRSTLVDFSTTAAFNIAGRQPNNLSFQNNILYGMNTYGVNHRYNSVLFSIDLNTSQNQLALVHEFDSIEGRVGYNQKGPSVLVMDICRSAEIPRLLISNDTICGSTAITITVDSSLLKDNGYWALYKDSIGALPLLTDTSGVFSLVVSKSTSFLLRGEGGCAQLESDAQSFNIILDSNYSYIDRKMDTICKKANYINPKGDTTFFVQSSFIDTTSFTSFSSCDSIVITSVFVDTMDLSLGFVSNFGAQSEAISNMQNVSYQWVDCQNDSILVNEINRNLVAPYTSNFAVILQSSSCTDTTNCMRLRNDNLVFRPSFIGGTYPSSAFSALSKESVDDSNNVTKTLEEMQLSFFPNPTKGLVNIISESVGELSLKVFNIQGQLVQEEILISSTNQVELSGEDGLYFITITNQEGEQANFKVVKQ